MTGFYDAEFNSLPPYLMKREDMELKDVVKENLLPFLPAKSLVRFMSVSKEWNQWITSPIIAFQQSNHFKKLSGFFAQNEGEEPTFVSLNPSAYGVPMPNLQFLPERVDILSSCNGLLVCVGRDSDDPYYICNPANKEWTPLPKPHLYHGTEAGIVLAFEPSARNIEQKYQLICAVPMCGELRFELYSSSTRSWTESGTTLVDMEGLSIKGSGFYMKGVAYWLTNMGMVIAFDVDEVHEVIPISVPYLHISDGVLTQIRGELCYIAMSHLSGNHYHIMIHGGINLSLKRRLVITFGASSTDSNPQFKVLPCFDGEKVMILFEDCIYSYSIRYQILEEISHVGIESFFAAKHLPYVNSLVQVPKVDLDKKMVLTA